MGIPTIQMLSFACVGTTIGRPLISKIIIFSYSDSSFYWELIFIYQKIRKTHQISLQKDILFSADSVHKKTQDPLMQYHGIRL